MAMSIFLTTAIWKLLLAHQVWAATIAATLASWMFSAYASTVTEPLAGASRVSLMWYRFVHMAAANLDKLKPR
jgi:hypothetical protein